MKVFISWSGPHSKKLGEAIRDWLPGVLQLVTPYFTPSDIEKGTRWSTDIAKELEESKIGILCVTKDNLHSDWILFEAGALSKRLQKSLVCPILFGITNTDLAGPLKQFQTTEFEKNDFHKLMTVINAQLDEHKLPQKTLDIVFEKWWPDLEVKINEILVDLGQPEQPIRSDRELLEEILQLNRSNLSRGGPSSISNRAVLELLENFITLHDSQATETDGYQAVLNTLQKMSIAVSHISKRYKGTSETIDQLLKRLEGLRYEVLNSNDESDEDEIPF